MARVFLIHGLAEANATEGWRRMESDKKGLNDIFTVLDINIVAETDVEFCRRVGERRDRDRPLVVGFFTDWARSTLLKNCRFLVETELSNISIVPDLTEKQRKMERKIVAEAEKRNGELSNEDRAKNLQWKMVGKKGQRRLIKGPESSMRGGGERGRGAGRARGNTLSAHLLPAVRGRGAWQPSVRGDPAARAAPAAAANSRADVRKRQRSNEEETQRKRGTGTRGRPPLRARAAAAAATRKGGGGNRETVVLGESGDEEEEDEVVTASQLLTRRDEYSLADMARGATAMETAAAAATAMIVSPVRTVAETETEAGTEEEEMIFTGSGIHLGEE
jgi:hypothetical protein